MDARVDDLDVTILRSLFSDVHHFPARSEIRESPSSLARKLRISEPTLRARLNRFRMSGFLQGWHVFLNPNVVREHCAQVHLEMRSSAGKSDVIDSLRLLDGVFLIARWHEDAVGVGLYYEGTDTLRNRLDLLRRLAGSDHAAVGTVDFPPCSHRFTQTDLAIVSCIEDAPRMEYAAIGEKARVSAKTARRRLDRMIRDHALFVTPTLNYRELRGALAADVLIFYESPGVARQTEARVLRLLDNVLVACIPGGTEHVWASVHLNSPSESDELQTRLRRLNGVREAYVNVIDDHVQVCETFRRQVEKLAALVANRALRPNRSAIPKRPRP